MLSRVDGLAEMDEVTSQIAKTIDG